MGKGRVYHDKPFTYEDPYSGRTITRLTDYLGHSNHFYFTDPCWFNDDRSFIFMSDREGQSNLFRYDLDDHKITQMTDLKGPSKARGCISTVNNANYFWWQNQVIELDLDTLEERLIWEAPPGMSPDNRANPTADGKYICTRLMEEKKQDKPTIEFAYSRFREHFFAKPFSQIVRIEIATGQMEVIHEDRCYIGHINTSSTLPDVLTFCHEGPWHLVEQRIWGLNIQTGEAWKIRPQYEGENLAVGHEYWFADGERIGYHGRPREDRGTAQAHGDHIFGHIRWDNTEPVEVSFPFHSGHFQSRDESIIVGDGTPALAGNRWQGAQPYIQLFQWDGTQYVGPRILAYHRSTFNNQHAHPHPRFTPDGKYVLYSSDLTDYSNMYLVEVGDFETLPLLTEDTPGRPDLLPAK
jgi:oligogalacturonide lyase